MQIFELFGSILLKDPGINSQLDKIDKKASQTSKGMGLSFGSIAGAALKFAAIIGAGLGLKQVYDEFAEGAKGAAQMETVLKSTKNAAGMTKTELIKLADAQGRLTQYDDDANIATENLLLTFTKIGKDVFPATLKIVNDMSTALGQDTKSSAIQLGKALQDPIKGVTALSKVGVNFTKEQKEQIKVLIESGKTMEAQKIILAELTTEFGGSAEAAGKTFPVQLTILKNSLLNIGAGILEKVMPPLQKFVGHVLDNMPRIQEVITNAINYIVPKFQEFSKYVSEKVTPILKAMGDWSAENMPKIQKYIVDMVNMVVPKFQTIINIVGQIVQSFFPSMEAATKSLGNPIKDLVAKALNLLISALSWVRDNHKFVVTAIQAIVAAMVIYKVAVIAANVIQTIHNAAIIAMAVAHGVVKAAIVISTAVQWLFNAAMAANPIGLVVIALAALGLAIYAIVKHWKDIVTWIKEAWNWLTKWNGTPAKDKKSTVTTTYKSNFSASPNPTGGSGYNSGGSAFAVGTRYLPRDMIIQAHEGEMIVPKSENPYANSGGGTIPTKPVQNFYIDKFIVQSKGDEINTLSQLQFMAAI